MFFPIHLKVKSKGLFRAKFKLHEWKNYLKI